ncbi:MAG: aldehyde dehydrogenase family protein [Candidatus Acidiferrales bacterium]
MSLRDRDLISIQDARESVERAAQAQKKFASFSQAQVDAVVDACAEAATGAAESLARLAVEETGYGNVPDKILKNRLAAVEVHRAIRGMRTVGIVREDIERKILEVAEPVGVVAAVIPSTNPTSTAIYKTLIALKSRNAIVLSPHPTAARCICESAAVLERAARKAGAPDGIIVCLQNPTLQGTQELMRQRSVGVILATGGTGLVRAAYSSGKPAYGVGPGNVPAFIERTADVPKAIADIFAGKTFDYGTICSSEQAIVVEDAVQDLAIAACTRQGAHWLSADEIVRLGAVVILPSTSAPNTKIVGRPATVVAEIAGIEVPASTRVLIARLEAVGREVPLSAEKLSPILAFYSVPDLAAGIERCRQLLQFGGLGHTASIHSHNDAAIREYGQAMPAFRVCVNTSAVHGSIGYSTNLFPAMTLGCGAPGGNITSDNIGPQHLMNIKRIAWESRGIEHRTIPADQRMSAAAPPPQAAATASAAHARANPTVIPDRRLIANIVEKVLSARGIPRGAAIAKPAAPSLTPRPSAAEVATSAVSAIFDRLSQGHPSASASSAAAAAADAKAATAAAASPEHSDAGKSAAEAAASASAGTRPTAAAAPAALQVPDFVSENDVRMAITRSEKIFISTQTIVTPSARDLASTHEVFVETASAPSARPRSLRD